MQTEIPDVPVEVPRTDGMFAAWLGRCTLRLLGWRIDGPIPPQPKIVFIVAPHSSAWDFVIGLAAKLALRIESSYLAKDSLFRWPLSILLNRTGGIPVDRSARHHLVERMAERFSQSEQMVLTVAPEGTRSRVAAWKTGFYRIAEAARVPILPVAIDYGEKAIRFGEALMPSGDEAADTVLLRSFYDGVRAHRDL